MGISHENTAVLCGFSQRLYKCLLLTRSSSVTRALTISVGKRLQLIEELCLKLPVRGRSPEFYHLRPVTWPSRSSELLLTAPTWSWWETQTNGRTTRAGSCGWLSEKDVVFHNYFNSDIVAKQVMKYVSSYAMKKIRYDCVHALVQKCFIKFKRISFS